MAKKWIGGLALLVFAASQGMAAAPPSPKDVMAHHIAVVKQDDVDGILKDYAENSVVVSPDGTFIGLARVREFFKQLAAAHHDWKSFIVTQEAKEHGVVLQKEIATGKVEVFVVRDGKIVFQAMQE